VNGIIKNFVARIKTLHCFSEVTVTFRHYGCNVYNWNLNLNVKIILNFNKIIILEISLWGIEKKFWFLE